MTQEQVNALSDAFRHEFDAEVEAEPVGREGRYRFAIVSDRFENMTHLQRQDALWETVDATLPREATLDVSLILAYTRSELATAG